MIGFLKKIFQPDAYRTICPRCLGKKHVDESDIIRLGMQLRWQPGQCAYCDGQGKISKDMVIHLPPDTAYLTSDLPVAERKRLIKGDPGAWARAENYAAQVDAFVRQIWYLYSECRLTEEQITGFYAISEINDNNEETNMAETKNFIIRVIAFHIAPPPTPS